MKSLERIFLISIVSIPLYAPPALGTEGLGSEAYPEFIPGEIIVKMKPTAATGLPQVSTLGIQAEDRLTSGGERIFHIEPSRLRGLSETQTKDRTLDVVEKLKARPDVEYAQPNFVLHILKTPNDPLYPKQWHYFNFGSGAGESPGGIDLPKVWDTNTGSSNVVVAVIDTGVLPNHEDIAGSGNLIPGYDMISDASRANDGDGRDSDATDAGDAMKKGECGFGLIPDRDYPSSWHGTHVAGTIGVGKTDNGVGIAGINWHVKLQAVRVLGKCGGSVADINDGIRWAAGLSVPGIPANPTPAKVINMSLGGGQPCSQSPATQSAINDAVNAGVTVVVAAGNDGKDAAGFQPAGCDNVITVAASDPQGKLTPFSNWGNVVEIMAPGGLTESGCQKPEAGILSMVETSSDRGNCGVAPAYAYYNGTSMASPHVAGVAALWLAADPALTPSTMLSALQAAARPRTATECPKPCGAGLLSALRIPGAVGGDKITVNLLLTPDKSSYAIGETASARATVKKEGAPLAGKTVTFSSDNASVATVAPGTAVSNASGQADATVTIAGGGEATVTASAEGASASKSVSSPAVPDLSPTGLLLLLAGVILIGLRWGRPATA